MKRHNDMDAEGEGLLPFAVVSAASADDGTFTPEVQGVA